ncbi:MAG: glycosyl hydrolase 115 family protein [Rikenellaceae bacterium]
MNIKQKYMQLLTLLLLIVISVNHASAKGFPLFKDGKLTQIYLSDQEPTPLKVAAQHLQDDIEMVTGSAPQIINDESKLSGNVIILSTLANNSLIKASKLEGLYDSYMMRAVKSPFDNVDMALVVVGSDAMGAVYGAYDISEKIGVSPLYWWCDITPERQAEVIIEECTEEPHQPSVKYRGIFINDEEASIIWSQRNSKIKSQGITPETYKRIFELMTRLKINAFWPSMMEEGAFFFEAKDENGVAVNPKNATDYGVWVGTSHCENMARNNNAEWYEWADKNKHLFSDDLHEFDYTVNPEAIEQYWRERLEESRNFNIIYTMGIRAVHDSAFKSRLMENPTLENRVKMLQKVLYRQRAIIKEVFGSENAVPQIFVPYEETAELYNGESKNGNEKCKGLDVPEDIILVSTDDNFSFLRQLPTKAELARRGGCGIYYHIAYQGNPSPYDWLTTIPYKQMQHELRKLYDAGAMKFWIVNVGDIKPSEMGLQYFMDIACDAPKEFSRDPREHVAESAADLFGIDEQQAAQFSDLFTRFCLRANIQKPEFMTSCLSIYYDTPTWAKFSYYSLTDFGDEAQRMIDDYIGMEAEARELYDSVDANHKDAFYHLAYYPIRSARLMAEKSYYYHKNLIYAKQGRFASVNGYKNMSLKAAEAIDVDLHYYNKVLVGGKWDGIMDPYATYNIFERVVDDANIPYRFVYNERFTEESTTEGIGSVCEGQLIGDEQVSLLFSSLEDNRRFIDIFATGLSEQAWNIESDKPWVKFSSAKGVVASEERVWVNIDWSAVGEGEQKATILVKNNSGIVESYPVVVHKFTEKIKPRSYVEGAGFVAIEAEHYTRSIKGSDGAQWKEITDLGHSGSSMAIEGSRKVTGAKGGAILEYQVYFTSTGTFDATLFRIPTLNEGKGKSCEMAVGVDNAAPFVLEGVRRKDQTVERIMPSGKKQSPTAWRMNAFIQIEKIPFEVTISEPGYHTIKIYQRDSEIAFDRIVIATNEQSSIAQSRAMDGAPESYNNISYVPMVEQATAKLTTEDIVVESYPELVPMLYAKFLFANYSTTPIVEEWGFTPVFPRNSYNKNTCLFGWDKDDLSSIISKQSVGSRPVPFFRLMSHWSKQPATFYATMHEGNYEITFHSGHVTEYYSGAKGRELNMNIHANGEELVNGLNVKSDEMSVVKYDAKVGKDNILKIDFSGDWSISAIEIYRK